MKKISIIIISIALIFLTAIPSFANFGMMGNFNWNSQASPVTSKDALEGQGFYNKIKNGELLCKDAGNNQFDKMGDYFMEAMSGSSKNHQAMDDAMVTMMGEQNSQNMHIVLGKRLSGCYPNEKIPSDMPSFLMPMMYGGGVNNMMLGYGANAAWTGFGVLGFLTWLVVLIDFVLLGAWLFRQLQKK